MKTLNQTQKMISYYNVKQCFGLTARQRDRFDACGSYNEILDHAWSKNWEKVRELLEAEGIL